MEARSRPRGQYLTNHINIGAPKRGEIELTDRQLQLLESRRRANNKANELDQQPKKLRRDAEPPGRTLHEAPTKKSVQVEKITSYQDDWAEQPAGTAPTVSWGDSESAASTSSSSANPAHQFYGQGLKGGARKLYDDTGASFHESKSEASSASSGPPLIRKLTSSATLSKSKSSSHDSKSDASSSASSSSLIKKLASSASFTKSRSSSHESKSEASSSSSSRHPETKKTSSFASLSRQKSRSYESKESASSGKLKNSTESRSTASLAVLAKVPSNDDAKSEVLSEPSVIKPMSSSEAPNKAEKIDTEQKIGIEWNESNHAGRVNDNNIDRRNTSDPTEESEQAASKLKKSRKEKPLGRRTSGFFSVARSKASTLTNDDQQKAFLRKMMQSYPSKSKSSKTHGNADESGSEASANAKPKPSRLSFSNRKASMLSSARSVSSASSASQDKAIMKKVLERAKKKKLASNPRKQNFVKQSSTRMKQLLSPKSRTSDESGNDERSFGEDERMNRRQEARLTKRGISTSPKSKALKSPVRKARRSPRNIVESSVSRWSSKPTKSPMHYSADEPNFGNVLSSTSEDDLPVTTSSLRTGDTASETLSSQSGEDHLQSSDKVLSLMESKNVAQSDGRFRKDSMKNKPSLLDIQQQETDSSDLLKKYNSAGSSQDYENSSSTNSNKEERNDLAKNRSIDSNDRNRGQINDSSRWPKQHDLHQNNSGEGQAGIQTAKFGLTKTQSHESGERKFNKKKTDSVMGVLSVDNSVRKIPGDDVEIKISVSSLSRRYDASSPAIPNVETNRTTPLCSNTTDPKEKEKEPEGYSEFLETLQAEVASTHSHLWRSFHALFHGNKRYPAPLVKPGRGDVSFDDKTKDMVTNMSTYIKKKYNVECNPGAQLANDKVVKGQATVKKLFGHQPKARPGFPGSTSTEDESYESDKENSGPAAIHQVHSSDSIDDVENDEFEVTLGQHVRKSMGGRGPATVFLHERNSENYSIHQSETTNASVSEETPFELDSCAASSNDSIYGDTKKGGRSTDSKSVISSSSAGKSSLHEPKQRKPDPVEEQREKQRKPDPVEQHREAGLYPKPNRLPDSEKRETQDVDYDPILSFRSNPSKMRRNEAIKTSGTPQTTSPELSIPWSGVKLRSVNGSGKSDSSSASIPASWTKVKLRRVEQKEENITNPDATHVDDGSESDAFHRIIVKKPSVDRQPAVVEKKTTIDGRHHPAVTVKTTIDQPQMPRNLAGKSAATPIEIIDVDVPADTEIIDVTGIESRSCHTESKSSNDSIVSAEGSVIVSLCDEANGGNSNEMKVVIGKKGLMKVEAKPSESKARVIWRLDRDEVKSAMLDMSAFKVKLLLENSLGTKDLEFPSSDQCMRFANALHEMNSAMEESSSDASESGDNSVYVEQLSVEEQRVLEEFRQRKKQKDSNTDSARSHLIIDSAASDPTKPVSVVDASSNNLSSPISDVSGASTVLTTEESNIAEPYHKMLRMQVPKEAVRHKMEKDQVDPRIITFVLGDASFSGLECDSLASGNILSIKEEKEAAVYRRMLKMMVPPEGVRHKMEKEGVSLRIINAVLGEDVSNGQSQDDSSQNMQLNDAEQSIAESYKKMLKMMVPKEAVEHKMRKENVDEKIIVAVVGGTLKKESAQIKDLLPSLSDEEESVASSYRQMLKLKISREAVRHKMKLEGIADHIIANVLGEVPKNPPPTAPAQAKPKAVKAGFHWSPVHSGEKFENSIWAKAKPLHEVETAEGVVDISKQVLEHVELFQKKPEAEKEAAKTKTNNTDTKVMARLIDINRANNVAISLKAFKEFEWKELAQIIEFVDPYAKITGDRALFMSDLLPAPAEVKAIKNYNGEEDRLVPAEKWFQQIVHIKRIEAKVRIMRTIETFREEADELGASFQQVTKACRQVMESEKLPDLLELVRQIGNRMNEGRGGEEAAGFKLDFLPRLAQTKGSDRKTTALDLVVTIFIAQNQKESLMLHEDLPDCQEASRIQIADLQSEVRNLHGQRQKCQKELEALKKEATKQNPQAKPAFSKPTGDSKSESALPVPSKSLKGLRSADTQVRTDVSSMHRELFEKRSQFIDSVLKGCSVPKLDDAIDSGKSSGDAPSVKELLQAVTSKNEDKEEAISPRASLRASQRALKDLSLSSNEMGYSLDSAIQRIDEFLTEADGIFPKLEEQQNIAVNTCKELAEFFCENGGEKSAANLLNMLSEFAENLRQAVRKHDEKQKAEERKKAQKEKKSQVAVAKPKTLPKLPLVPIPGDLLKRNPTENKLAEKDQSNLTEEPSEKKSLVLMVNEMLRVAGDKGKEDFVKGVVYDNPDDKLKQIYDAERKRRGGGGETISSSPKNGAVKAAIKSRSKSLGHKAEEELDSRKPVQPQVASTKEELPASFSLDYSTDSSSHPKTRWSDVHGMNNVSKTNVVARKGRKRSIVDRWTRKIEDDEIVDDEASRQRAGGRLTTSTAVKKEDRDLILAQSGSHDSEDANAVKKQRETYMNRWARPVGMKAPESRDVEEESDVGAVMEIKRRTRQRYINRWASKPSDPDDDSESDLFE